MNLSTMKALGRVPVIGKRAFKVLKKFFRKNMSSCLYDIQINISDFKSIKEQNYYMLCNCVAMNWSFEIYRVNR